MNAQALSLVDHTPDTVACMSSCRPLSAKAFLAVLATACSVESGFSVPAIRDPVRCSGDAAARHEPERQRDHRLGRLADAPPARSAVPPDIRAYVYVNEATFVDGLINIAGERPTMRGPVAPRSASPRALASFLRGDYLARMNLVGRASLFAHELTHVSQGRLREGGRGRPAQWILEGHAEWVKFKVVDLLGYRAYAESRDIMMRAALASTIKFFLDLSAARRQRRPGSEATRRLGALATYGQAFLAVDWLVERYRSAKLAGVPRALRARQPIRGSTGRRCFPFPTASSPTSSAPPSADQPKLRRQRHLGGRGNLSTWSIAFRANASAGRHEEGESRVERTAVQVGDPPPAPRRGGCLRRRSDTLSLADGPLESHDSIMTSAPITPIRKPAVAARDTTELRVPCERPSLALATRVPPGASAVG